MDCRHEKGEERTDILADKIEDLMEGTLVWRTILCPDSAEYCDPAMSGDEAEKSYERLNGEYEEIYEYYMH